ncbi:MAG: CRISPR system precrRNA processing endoribonuclease RAMP protein Cas6 [Burkholderiales bacterium]|jgi:hypothetical protein|nr:CRISPR system precrRNA processing endoribonuclease RAMP protein Cas6 [Burkholderiales bacterium]
MKHDMLPIARYRLTATLRAPLRLPDYAGSLLRGQFGAALRHIACMTRQPTCTGCPLQTTCPYPRIFEAVPPSSHTLQSFSAIPNAYVIEPPPLGMVHYDAGQDLVFHMVLAGAAREQLALILFAWQRALAQGLTKQRVVADLVQVDWVNAEQQPQQIWSASVPTLSEHPAILAVPAAPPAPKQLRLHINTPLRLQQQGRALGLTELEPRTLLAALTRRLALVLEFHAGQSHWGEQVPRLVTLATQVQDQRQLRWHDWVRYSSRQQQEMTLGGVLGTWNLIAPGEVLAELWSWLWLGQWLHVGKNATMGMGGYTLETQA